MTFDNLLDDLLNLDNNASLNVKENFTALDIEIKFTKLIIPNIDWIKKLLKFIFRADKLFNLSIEYNNFCPITFEDCSSAEEFIDNVNKSIDINSVTDESDIETLLKLRIKKNIIKGVSIYSLKYFGKYLSTFNLKEFFINIDKYNTNDFFFFYIADDSIHNSICSSTKFIFTGFNDTIPYQHIENDLTRSSFQTNCITVGNKFTLTPTDYDLNSIITNDINTFFNKLKIIYSLMYISTSSELTNHNLNIKIHGYKSISLDLNLNTLNYDNLTIYYQIYNWIYSTDRNITDKLGIARNIISLYITDHPQGTCNFSSIYLNESILTSVNASYSIYLKENVQNYLQVKSNIIDKISETNIKINGLVNMITRNFIKNLSSIGTFIVSTLFINAIKSGKFSAIMTHEVFCISVFLLLISIIYLEYTLKEYKFNKLQLTTLYNRLKESYKDILIERDIDVLFKNDEYFNADIKVAEKKKNFYSRLWIFVVIICAILIILLHHYYNNITLYY